MDQPPLILEANRPNLPVLRITKNDVAGVVGVFEESAEGIQAAVRGFGDLLSGSGKRNAQHQQGETKSCEAHQVVVGLPWDFSEL